MNYEFFNIFIIIKQLFYLLQITFYLNSTAAGIAPGTTAAVLICMQI